MIMETCANGKWMFLYLLGVYDVYELEKSQL